MINGRGRKEIDKYGDHIQSTCLKGDHWRQRHDQIKLAIYRLCMWAGIPVEMEVFNLFSGLIPQQGLARIDRDSPWFPIFGSLYLGKADQDQYCTS